jgi:ubiquinone biosynthesis protein
MNAALRTLRIGTAIVSFAGWNLWRRFGLIHPVQTPGERFAEALQGLGTTFVKLGQHLSLRPDLLPAGYIAALQNLQDHVAAFPASQARTTIEQALGAPVESVFSSFEPEPFAAASIAQVHGAILPDGRAVIVKVRRPGIAEQIDRDLRLALIAVRLAGGVIPGLKRYRLSQIVSEVWANLRREADFRLEARNVRRFAEALHGLPGIKVPDIEERLCRDSILVVERSHGARVDEVPDPVRGRALARRLVDAYLHQFFTIGAFHGDPHPGNLFITPEGEICFHDFGIVGTLDKATRRALAAFMLAFVEQDADWVVDAWFEMGVLAQQASERAVFRRIVAELLDDFSRMPLAQWSLGEAFQRLIAGGRGVGFGIPTNLLVLGRTMLLIESAVRALDPQFSLLDALLEKARAIQTTSIGGLPSRRRCVSCAAMASACASAPRSCRVCRGRWRTPPVGSPRRWSRWVCTSPGRCSCSTDSVRSSVACPCSLVRPTSWRSGSPGACSAVAAETVRDRHESGPPRIRENTVTTARMR